MAIKKDILTNLFEEYSKNNIDISFKEFADAVNGRWEEEQKENEKLREEWYQALSGRYFQYYNRYIAVYTDKDGQLRSLDYVLEVGDDFVSYFKFDEQWLQEDMFNNPYSKRLPEPDEVFAVEITEETFNRVAEKYTEIYNNVKKYYDEIK